MRKPRMRAATGAKPPLFEEDPPPRGGGARIKSKIVLNTSRTMAPYRRANKSWVFSARFSGRPETVDFGVETAPTEQKPFPTGGPLLGPPVCRSFCPVGAGWSRKIDDLRSAQKPCTEIPSERWCPVDWHPYRQATLAKPCKFGVRR